MFAEMEYKYPANILFAVIIVIIIIFYAAAFAKKERIMAVLNLNRRIRMKAIKTILLAAGASLIVFSLLGPQVFSGYSKLVKTGMDIYVLIDTSKSMLVTDVKPDRMTAAKKIVENIINSLEGDRIGFIPFASDAYIQMPLTDDYQLAKMFLNVIDTEMIGGGGTNLAAAMRLAAASFSRTSGSDRVILVISDGEEQEGSVADAVKKITDDRVKIFTVGVGTAKGGLVPVYNTDGIIVSYLSDSSGNPVTSRLETETLRELARTGGGSYYQADVQGVEAAALIEDLSLLKRDATETENVKRFEQLYQYFLGAGALLFLVFWLLPETKSVAGTGVIE